MNPIEISCPHCARTLTGSEGVAEQTLRCPDCRTSVTMPDIRLGVNPRHRAAPSGKTSAYPSTVLGQDMLAAELLVDNLASLFRRKEEMGEQIDKLLRNAEVCRKQIELLQHPAAETTRSSESSDPDRNATLLAIAVALVTLVSALTVVVLLSG